MSTFVADFKKFLMQGSLITLAVAFIMGTVFAALLKALIADLITPIIALIFGKPDFSALSFSINSSQFLYGDFINALFTFAVTGLAVFLFVVKPYESFTARRAQDDPNVRACPECTTEIPAAARRCPQCTAQIPAVTPA
jgi:large conductance mechanosensitive channel